MDNLGHILIYFKLKTNTDGEKMGHITIISWLRCSA